MRRHARLVRPKDRTSSGWAISPGGAADPTTTAWAIGALQSARLTRRLELPAEPLNAAEAYMDQWRRLVDTQATEGHVRGSWSSTVHAAAGSGGRLYQTALNVLSLEVYFRYPPVWRDRSLAEADPLAVRVRR